MVEEEGGKKKEGRGKKEENRRQKKKEEYRKQKTEERKTGKKENLLRMLTTYTLNVGETTGVTQSNQSTVSLHDIQN